jgi:energy-coupling factor transport system permease protein
MKNNYSIFAFISSSGTNVTQPGARLDPRTKMLAALALIIATLLTDSLAGVAWLGGGCVLLLGLTRTPTRLVGRNLLLLSWLFAVTFGTVLWQEGSLWRGGVAVARLGITVGWVTMLAHSTPPLALVAGLEGLLRPLRRVGLAVGPNVAVVTMLTLRFIPILLEERRALVRAYIARGIDLRQGRLVERAQTYVLLCIPLLTSMLRRADVLAAAMDNRAFQARADRTSLYSLQMTPSDYIVLGLAGILLFIVGLQLVI